MELENYRGRESSVLTTSREEPPHPHRFKDPCFVVAVLRGDLLQEEEWNNGTPPRKKSEWRGKSSRVPSTSCPIKSANRYLWA